MKLPKLYAEASLGRPRTLYRGSTTLGPRLTGLVVPAVDCSGVDCDAAQFFCYLSLDLDPVSCGLFYGCCQGAGKTGNGQYPDAGADIPVSSKLPLTSDDSAALSQLNATIAQLQKDLKRQLNRIQRCACGDWISAVSSSVTAPSIPFIPPTVVVTRPGPSPPPIT